MIYDQFKDAPDGEKITLDHRKVGMAKLLAYIVGWTFVGFDGQPLPYRPDEPDDIRAATIDGLDQDTYRELIAAVTAHEEREEAALRGAKKNPYHRAGIMTDLMIARPLSLEVRLGRGAPARRLRDHRRGPAED